MSEKLISHQLWKEVRTFHVFYTVYLLQHWMRVSLWWALCKGRTNNVHVKIKDFFIQPRQTVLSLIDSKRVLVLPDIELKHVLFGNHTQEMNITGKNGIFWKTMHFAPRRLCTCTTNLISEGQLGASLQDVFSQALSPIAAWGLSHQLTSVKLLVQGS